MRKLMNTFTAILLASVLFTSCNSRSAEKAQAESIRAQAIADANKLPTIDSATFKKLEEPTEYTFVPTRIEVSEVRENKKDTWGEGQYPVHTFSVDVFFIASDNTEVHMQITGKQYTEKGALDGYDDPGTELKNAKAAYETIIHSEPTDLILTMHKDAGKVTITKKQIVTKKMAGNATVRITPTGPFYEGSVIN